MSVSRELCRMIREAKNAVEIKKYTALMIAGDFNFPRVHWIEGSGYFGNENMQLSENIFIETLDDCALNQCVTDPTFCEGNILDLLLTCSPERIFCIQHEAPLGDLENAFQREIPPWKVGAVLTTVVHILRRSRVNSVSAIVWVIRCKYVL